MYSFCPHCGQTLNQAQTPGQTVVCLHCKQTIGIVRAAPVAKVVDQTEELIRQGTVARCPVCQQVVQVQARGSVRSIVPHAAPPRKICPGSGKSASPAATPVAVQTPVIPAPVARPPAGKDLSAYMTRETIKVIACRKNADPTMEELSLQYLDKSDRVRLHIESLRDLLGASFRMRDYPTAFNRPQLAVWGDAEACVVAKKHPQGGMQPMTDAEIAQVLADLRQAKQRFFA